MTSPTLTKNTTYYTAALTIQKILAFVYFWFISNNLFPDQLGQYVFALSFAAMFSIFVDLGLSPVLTREASKNQKQANRYLKNILGIKIPLAIIAIIAAWIFINITGKSAEIKLLVYIASFIMALDSFSLSFWVIFRSRQNLKYESIATILVQLIIFTLGLLALKFTGQVRYLMSALLAASLFNFSLSFLLLKLKLKFCLKPSYDPEIAKHFLRIIPAFALAGIFVKIYNTSDSVLLGYLDSDEAVGFFAVPAKIVYALQQIIPAGFAAVIFPAFSFYYANSKEMLSNTFNKAFKYLTIISLPISAGIISLAPKIVYLVWPNYIEIVPTLIVMSAAIPFIFLAFPTGYLLNSCDRQKNTTINRGIITGLSILLNVILIPILGFFGAGITFLITNLILFLLDFLSIKTVINLNYLNLLKMFLKSLAASVIMILGVITVSSYFLLPIVIAWGVLLYFLSLYLFKGFRLREIRELVEKGIK